jgi:hypothetical protein
MHVCRVCKFQTRLFAAPSCSPMIKLLGTEQGFRSITILFESATGPKAFGSTSSQFPLLQVFNGFYQLVFTRFLFREKAFPHFWHINASPDHATFPGTSDGCTSATFSFDWAFVMSPCFATCFLCWSWSRLKPK